MLDSSWTNIYRPFVRLVTPGLGSCQRQDDRWRLFLAPDLIGVRPEWRCPTFGGPDHLEGDGQDATPRETGTRLPCPGST